MLFKPKITKTLFERVQIENQNVILLTSFFKKKVVKTCAIFVKKNQQNNF